MTIQLDDSDVVRVKNVADLPFTIMYDSKPYKLMPGQDSFIPFAAAALWFGDPRSSGALASVQNERGIRVFIPDRETEVRRLRVKYDNQFGDETTIIRHPLVEMYDITTGERIPTVLDDPAGESVIAATPTVADNNSLMALIAKQQDQIEKLTGVVMAQMQAAQQPADTPADPVPPENETRPEEVNASQQGTQLPPPDDSTPVDPSVNATSIESLGGTAEDGDQGQADAAANVANADPFATTPAPEGEAGTTTPATLPPESPQ